MLKATSILFLVVCRLSNLQISLTFHRTCPVLWACKKISGTFSLERKSHLDAKRDPGVSCARSKTARVFPSSISRGDGAHRKTEQMITGVRERAVRLVAEQLKEPESEWTAKSVTGSSFL